jgi:fatty acid desaturase
MDIVVATVLCGVGATAFIDLWSLARRALFGVLAPDYGLVGRWLGHMPRGRFVHAPIASSSRVRGEALLGWCAHYLIGIGFAALLPLLWGGAWFAQPRLLPALLVGVATVLAPYLLLQPGMGAGLAASRTQRPWTARAHSLVMHAMFGIGLYLNALALARVG